MALAIAPCPGNRRGLQRLANMFKDTVEKEGNFCQGISCSILGFVFVFSNLFPFSFSCVFVSFFRLNIFATSCFQCFFPSLSQRPNLSTFEALYIIPGTWHNQFLVVVSVGSFQMFTWNMVVSPFPSIKKLVVWSSRYTSFFYRKKMKQVILWSFLASPNVGQRKMPWNLRRRRCGINFLPLKTKNKRFQHSSCLKKNAQPNPYVFPGGDFFKNRDVPKWMVYNGKPY